VVQAAHFIPSYRNDDGAFYVDLLVFQTLFGSLTDTLPNCCTFCGIYETWCQEQLGLHPKPDILRVSWLDPRTVALFFDEEAIGYLVEAFLA